MAIGTVRSSGRKQSLMGQNHDETFRRDLYSLIEPYQVISRVQVPPAVRFVRSLFLRLQKRN